MAAASSVAACCKAILAILASEIHPREAAFWGRKLPPSGAWAGVRARWS